MHFRRLITTLVLAVLVGGECAVQEQLGLKLEPVMVDAQVLVIAHIERPVEN